MAQRFGVMQLQNRSVAELAEWAGAFEGAGADAVYVADHLANPHDLADEWQDGWLSLAAIAAATTTCRLGPLVSTFVLHPPVALARMALTLQTICGGRLVLGVGAGGAPLDRAFSNAWDEIGQLAQRFSTGLATLRQLFDGSAVEVPPVPSVGERQPPPSWGLDAATRRVTRPEVMVAAQHGSTMRAAVAHGDAWNVFSGRRRDGETALEMLSRQSRRMDELCAEMGREPSTLRRTVLLDALPDLAPTTAEDLARTAEHCWGLGYDEVIVYAWFSRDSGPRTPEALLRFIERELPSLRG
jgi:alkanesulfonate monooxygenase SsuD/methylene tetrahydromethanopterin reductase-like flavin-dependent oxidoreductase (luciferase family)